MRLATMALRLRQWWPSVFPQTIDGRCFHFKISDSVIAKTKICEVIDQLRITEAQTKYPALRTIKARAGYRDALVIVFCKMFQQCRTLPC